MDFPNWLSKRLKLTLPGKKAQIKMMPQGSSDRFSVPENSRKSSVLLLLFPERQSYSLFVIKRVEDSSVHSGQIAFPGGKIERFDTSPEEAALREANEEIHLDRKPVQILGRLSPLYIPASNFEVFPIVGFQDQKPENLSPSKSEVSKILTISLVEHLPQKSMQTVFPSSKTGFPFSVPVYRLDATHFIWGASAMILSELEALWEEYSAEPKI